MKKGLFTLLILVWSSAAISADLSTLQALCVGCHGPNGVSANNLWPNLAGQKKDYLIKQLKAFKKGERKDPMMTPIAVGLSDDSIEILAEHYSKIKK